MYGWPRIHLYLAGGGVSDTATNGLVVEDGGSVTVRDFRVEVAGEEGVVVAAGGELTANRTTVHAPKGHGFLLREGALGSPSGCEANGGAQDGFRVESTAPSRSSTAPPARTRAAAWLQTAPGERLAVDGLNSVSNGKRDAWGSGSAENTDPAGSGAADALPDRADGPLGALNALIGLENVKQQVRTLVNLTQLAQRREQLGMPAPPMSRHLIFAGPPGTGKTTVARLYGAILAELGSLRSGHLVEVSRADLVASRRRHGHQDLRDLPTSAGRGSVHRRGVHSPPTAATAAPTSAVRPWTPCSSSWSDHRDDVVVVAAGYSREMESFLSSNPGLASRFSRTVEFENYSVDDLVAIMESMCTQHQYELGRARPRRSPPTSGPWTGTPDSATAVPRAVFEEMVDRQAIRLSPRPRSARTICGSCSPRTSPPPPPPRPPRPPHRPTTQLTRLGDMIGLAEVKREVADLVNLITTARHRAAAGLPVPTLSNHLVFTGPPGTGKTTVARSTARCSPSSACWSAAS